MKRISALPLIVLVMPLPAQATTGGPVGTLTVGYYECERPGPPGGVARIPVPEANFKVTTASRYIASDGSVGTYLLTGKMVTMTSGSMNGQEYMLVRRTYLRPILADGGTSDVRCVLARGSDRR